MNFRILLTFSFVSMGPMSAHAAELDLAESCKPQPECRVLYDKSLKPGPPINGIKDRQPHGLSDPGMKSIDAGPRGNGLQKMRW